MMIVGPSTLFSPTKTPQAEICGGISGKIRKSPAKSPQAEASGKCSLIFLPSPSPSKKAGWAYRSKLLRDKSHNMHCISTVGPPLFSILKAGKFQLDDFITRNPDGGDNINVPRRGTPLVIVV